MVCNFEQSGESYERFAELITEDAYLQGLDFAQICVMSGGCERDIDMILRVELGMGGRAFIRALRNMKCMSGDKRF